MFTAFSLALKGESVSADFVHWIYREHDLTRQVCASCPDQTCCEELVEIPSSPGRLEIDATFRPTFISDVDDHVQGEDAVFRFIVPDVGKVVFESHRVGKSYKAEGDLTLRFVFDDGEVFGPYTVPAIGLLDDI